MKVTLIYRDQEYLVDSEQVLSDALEKIGIDPLSVMAIRNGLLITGETVLHENEQIRLIAVISGGLQT